MQFYTNRGSAERFDAILYSDSVTGRDIEFGRGIAYHAPDG